MYLILFVNYWFQQSNYTYPGSENIEMNLKFKFIVRRSSFAENFWQIFHPTTAVNYEQTKKT